MRVLPLPFLMLLLLPAGGIAQFLPDNADYWWLHTDDGVAHYVVEVESVEDSAPTWVVLHGGYGADHSYLIEVVLPLADGHRFVLYDQRGSLRSPAPDSTVTFDRFVEDLDAIRRALELERIRIIAHSNGANIALDYLGTHPERVEGLVLLSPPLSFLHSEPFDPSLGVLIERHRELDEAFRAETTRRIEDAWAALGLSETEGLTPREGSLRRRVEAAGWNTKDPMNWRAMRSAFFEPAVFEALQRNTEPEVRRARTLRKSLAFVEARIPIRVILGDGDYVDPEAVVWTGVIQAAQDGRLIVVERAGHNAWIDRTEAFGAALSEVLEELTSTSPPLVPTLR